MCIDVNSILDHPTVHHLEPGPIDIFTDQIRDAVQIDESIGSMGIHKGHSFRACYSFVPLFDCSASLHREDLPDNVDQNRGEQVNILAIHRIEQHIPQMQTDVMDGDVFVVHVVPQ